MLKKTVCAVILLCVLNSSEGMAGVLEPVTHLGHDLENTFVSWPGLLILGGSISALALTQKDPSIQESFQDGRHLGKLDSALSVVGSPYLIDGSSLMLYGIGEVMKKEQIANTGETLIEALFLTEMTTLGLKLAFDRERPDGGSRGFPSGHAARCFAVASVLQTLHGPVVGIPALLAAGLVSFSRLDANKHNASDIVFGAALGAAFGWGTARFHNKIFHKVALTPMLTEGQGVMVSMGF